VAIENDETKPTFVVLYLTFDLACY